MAGLSTMLTDPMLWSQGTLITLNHKIKLTIIIRAPVNVHTLHFEYIIMINVQFGMIVL